MTTLTGNKQLAERQKVRKKMSKAQIQLAIIKKKQCDSKALAIVEQLIEPDVNPDWLLQNLGFINKCHLEDAIEERAIIKLCGYVLCPKPLTVIVKQLYHISTRSNKVYNISKRKNFCSSLCYAASNYLLEQMFESPLWSRDEDDVPIFRIMPKNSSKPCSPGDEINVSGITVTQNANPENLDDIKMPKPLNVVEQVEEDASSIILKHNKRKNVSNDKNTKKDAEINNMYVNTNTENLSDCNIYPEDINQDINTNHQTCMKYENCNLQKDVKYNLETDIQTENVELEKYEENQSSKTDNLCNNSKKSCNDSVINEINNDQDANNKTIILDKMCSNEKATTTSESSIECKINKRSKNKKCKQIAGNIETQSNIYYELVKHVEQCVKEWITDNTLCLLLNKTNEKHQLPENLTQRDKSQLYKRLNKLQLQNEEEGCINVTQNILNPVPEMSELEEEGKKLELKVRAFYNGQMTYTPKEDSNEEPIQQNYSIMPLTTALAPNAIRRRIFLEKLNKILPDLLCALTAKTSLLAECIYNNERILLTKLLINTFNLSAMNIVFKSAEWNLVGLIIIKMISLIDAQLQSLLACKQASMYTSMILMSYKLDTHYLDRLIMEIIDNAETYTSNEEQC